MRKAKKIKTIDWQKALKELEKIDYSTLSETIRVRVSPRDRAMLELYFYLVRDCGEHKTISDVLNVGINELREQKRVENCSANPLSIWIEIVLRRYNALPLE